MEDNERKEVTEEVTTTVDETAELKKQNAELEAQIKNLKATLSERNSESATRRREAEEWKKKFESTLDEQEQAELKRREKEEATARELAELKRDNAINKYKAKYLAMGYSEELAQSSAEARADGNDELLFTNEAKFAQMVNETTKAEILKTQPTLTAGKPISNETVQQAELAEMMKWANM